MSGGIGQPITQEIDTGPKIERSQGHQGSGRSGWFASRKKTKTGRIISGNIKVEATKNTTSHAFVLQAGPPKKKVQWSEERSAATKNARASGVPERRSRTSVPVTTKAVVMGTDRQGKSSGLSGRTVFRSSAPRRKRTGTRASGPAASSVRARKPAGPTPVKSV